VSVLVARKYPARGDGDSSVVQIIPAAAAADREEEQP
jgi:hypothetical protein